MDLYYRLNVFPFELPPLRRRVEDIPMLIEESQKRSLSSRSNSLQFSPAAMKALCRYDWPGNIRELANVVERLAILYPGQLVQADDLPEKYRRLAAEDPSVADVETRHPESAGVESGGRQLSLHGIDLKDYISTIETEMIVQALNLTEGVVAKAAKLLNLQRTTLVEKMRKYSINRQETVSEN
jgi:sigma-54 specific flagellar transcriptional regulator A